MAEIMHMKGPKIDGKRNPIPFPSRADLVEGLDEKIEEATGGASGAGETSAGLVKLYSTTGNNTDGAMTQAAMTLALQNKVGVNDTISGSKVIMGGGSSLQESFDSGKMLTLYINESVVKVGQSISFKIATNSTSTIIVSSADTNIATASLSGNMVTVTGKSAGSTIITVTTENKSVTYEVTVIKNIPTTLNDCSWSLISEISKAGTGDLYWDVGDAKEITLTGKIGNQLTLANEKLCVFILHFNYAMNGTSENNIIWGGFKSALTNGKDVALADAKYNTTLTDGTVCFTMNHRGQTSDSSSSGYYNTNYGGWKGSDLRYDILGATSQAPSQYNQSKSTSNVGYDATAATLTSPKSDTLLAALPSDLRNVIRLWTRWIDAVGNSSNTDANIKATVDAITLLAEFEVQGARTYANEYEKNHQAQMAYYAAGNSKVRYKHSDTSSAVCWWCASPRYDNDSTFCNVNTSGGAGDNGARYSRALAPAFKT